MINNKDKIDEFFRQSLEGYQARPSLNVWKRLDARLFGTGSRWIWITGSLLLLCLVAGGILILVTRTGEAPVSTGRAAQESVAGPSSDINGVPELHPAGSSKSEEPGAGDNPAPSTITVSAVLPASQVPKTSLSMALENEYTGSSQAGVVVIAPAEPPVMSFDELIRLKGLPSGMIARSFVPGKSVALAGNPLQAIYPGLKNIYVRKSDLQAGFHFFPAAAFYPENPTRQALQGEFFFRAGLWTGIYVETGVGISVAEEMGEYRMNYQTLDSVGYYMNVNSFSIDPQDPSKIILDLSQETLFDSVPHEQKIQEPNRYTYLYIPVSVGWKFFREKRVSLSLRAGGKFALLLGKHEPTAQLNLAGAELISSETLVPSRRSTAWLFSAGLAFGYDLSSHLKFNLEPVFEQYISNPYDAGKGSSGRKNPYMFGIRTGLSYSF